MTHDHPPAIDELEISVFGPGLGESILVHLGYNEWCMIDSCIGRGETVSAAVRYLEKLGKNCSEGVLLVLATHWHDDHIRGIAKSLSGFKNATFASSAAMRTNEFFRLVQIQTQLLQGRSGLDEFAQILDILTQRKNSSGKSPVWAVQDRLLLRRTGASRAFPASVTALSPSDEAVKAALRQIGSLIPLSGQPQRSITNRPPNEASVVLYVEVGNRTVLLGADLEHSANSQKGWLAILNLLQTPCAPAEIFKVAHHGSSNADCPDMWQQLLKANPVAILTPFASGRGLPQPSDIARLRSRTSALYCTAQSNIRLPKRDKITEKKLKERERIAIDGTVGQVRVRWSAVDPAASPRVDLFDGAYQV